MFDRIPQWSHPVLDFFLQGVFWFVFYYRFDFTSNDWSVQIMFLLDSILADYVSKTFSISSLLFIVFSYVFLHICDIGCYCSFLILFIWVLSFSWLSWLEACLFCLSFQKNQLLISSIFSIIVWSLFYLFPL